MIKWILAVIGFIVGKWPGAIIGFLLGSFFDSAFKQKNQDQQQNTTQDTFNTNSSVNEFIHNLVILTAAIMLADGRVLKDELDYVKAFFRQQFGDKTAQQAILLLRDTLKRPIPLQQACFQIRNSTTYDTRKSLMQYLFSIANIGGISQSELNTLSKVASYLGVQPSDYEAIKNSFVKNSHWAYTTLGVSEQATNDDIKKAYRAMAIKYHPDKVAHMGEAQQKAATEKFKKINEAYDELKKQRGFS